MQPPSEFQFTPVPSAKTQQALMIEAFVELTKSDIGGDRYQASIRRSEKTQSLLDAMWDKIKER